jgi:hypothetical protein
MGRSGTESPTMAPVDGWELVESEAFCARER